MAGGGRALAKPVLVPGSHKDMVYGDILRRYCPTACYAFDGINS
ncbi:hypothetical protein Z945_3642 [Sulfitobacter noctilucae]|nr:hypothetical protein Z945_3642 [Sulfitobacter noctilucae]